MALAWQTIPSAPEGTATPSTSSAPTPPAEGKAQAADPGLLGSPLFMLLMFVPLIVMMLWSSKSAQKKQAKVLLELKKGDMVLTQAGLRGKLVELGDRFAKVEIAAGTKVEILKTAILGKDNPGTAAQLEKK